MKKLLPWLLLLLLSACAPAQNITLTPRNVFYAGGENGVKTALRLAGYTLVPDPAQAEVFVLNGEIPDGTGIAERIRNGAGLVLIPGKDTSHSDLQILLGQPVTVTDAEDAVSLVAAKGVEDPLLTEIVWNGLGELGQVAPEFVQRRRIALPVAFARSGFSQERRGQLPRGQQICS